MPLSTGGGLRSTDFSKGMPELWPKTVFETKGKKIKIKTMQSAKRWPWDGESGWTGWGTQGDVWDE